MPLTLNTPETIVIDKIRIDEFSVRPQDKIVTIYYSRGYENEQGGFMSKGHDQISFKDVEFEPTQYESVKTTLYQMLSDHLNK